MVKNKFNKRNFLNKIFIIASAINFLILFILFSVSKDFSNHFSFNIAGGKEIKEDISSTKKDVVVETNDPFITKNISVEEDFLARPIYKEEDPFMGEENAEIKIIGFSDFNCEFCRKQEEIIKNVMKKYEGKVGFIWKSYPEPSGISLKAATAAYCAHKQGEFWAYHDFLFDSFKNDNSPEVSLLLKLASKLKLDEKKFIDCLNSEEGFNFVMDSIKEADALQISGVPFFFVGDQEILGEIDEKDLERIIEIELNK